MSVLHVLGFLVTLGFLIAILVLVVMTQDRLRRDSPQVWSWADGDNVNVQGMHELDSAYYGGQVVTHQVRNLLTACGYGYSACLDIPAGDKANILRALGIADPAPGKEKHLQIKFRV